MCLWVTLNHRLWRNECLITPITAVTVWSYFWLLVQNSQYPPLQLRHSHSCNPQQKMRCPADDIPSHCVSITI